MAEQVINSDNIREYLAGNGGKARNSDVVLHFKEHLNHPDPKKKEYYRQRFKECINVVAVKKDENGTKYIVLKKKFREASDPEPQQFRIGHPHEYEQGHLEKSPNRSDEERIYAEARWKEQKEEQIHADNLQLAAKWEREQQVEKERKLEEKRLQEDKLRNERTQDSLIRREEQQLLFLTENELFEKKSQEKYESNSSSFVVEPSFVSTDKPLSNSYTGPVGQTDVIRSKEGERIIEEKAQISSVNHQVKIINNSFEEERTPKKVFQKSSAEASKEIYSTLNSEKERLWILYSAENDVANLSLLLQENKDLVNTKDFINGWTAMHWGAKHGRKEMIRLVASSGVDINMRSHAGYTALHIAAIYNREAMMQFLTKEYQADVNIRDYSGKRPHQYLVNTEQTYLQHDFKDISSGVLPNIKVGHLEKFEAQEKRSSKFGSLRASFRALRTWGSTESIPKKRSISTEGNSSPKMRPRSLHVEHHRSFTPESSHKTRPMSTIDFDKQLMPPPAPPNIKKSKISGSNPRDFHKSESIQVKSASVI